MPSEFKSIAETNIGISETTIYTCPAGRRAIVLGLRLANTTPSNVTGSVRMNDVSASKLPFIVRNAPISATGSLIAIQGTEKQILEAGDQLRVQSSAASSLDITGSVVELF